MLSLYVDTARWRSHLDAVAAAQPGMVPVAKGNGYGLGLGRLAALAADLGATTLAIGTYAEVADVAAFPGDLLVLSPWRPVETDPARRSDAGRSDPGRDPRVVHTVGRVEDLNALASNALASNALASDESASDARPRVVLELLTSMRRHGFAARQLREAAGHLDGVRVEGFALHLPVSRGSHLPELHRLMTDLVASGIDSRTVFVSHLDDEEHAALRSAYPDFVIRPRTGTRLWLGDRGALSPRTTVLDVHEVRRGDVYGYRGRRAPGPGHLVIVSGGTAHGIGLEAPTGAATLRDRAARVARGGLDAAGLVRSPFTIDGKQRRFAEPPHMQASMLFLPAGASPPEVGEEVPVQVRFTTTSFDQVVT